MMELLFDQGPWTGHAIFRGILNAHGIGCCFLHIPDKLEHVMHVC